MLTVKKGFSVMCKVQGDLIRQNSFSFYKNVLKKQTEIFDFTMWLSRNTYVLDSFSPEKWEVNACSM